MNRRGLCFAILVLIIVVILSRSSQAKNSSYFQKERFENYLKSYAQSITVRVFSAENPDYGGSGVLIKRDNNLYTVVTNDHVIDNKKKSYKVQTPNNKIYSADILKLVKSEDDIGFLVFYSPDSIYNVAALVREPIVKKRTLVIAGGFPFTKDLKQSHKFEITKGSISEILNRPFVGGYQIGYSNQIINGMSGGPMLNYYGQLIGINGMGQEPLFGNPYIFKDGSTISKTEWNKFSRLSWAVPIQIIQKLL